MPKRTLSEKEEGIREEAPDVVIIYKGENPLIWESQDYYGDNDTVEFTLIPGVKEEFNRGYAKAVFGDWELKKATKAEQKLWADMVKDRIDRSPTCDGRLPMVEIYEADGKELGPKLWDAYEEFNEWIKRHGAKMLPRPDKKASGINYEMPKVLIEADSDTLKKLWEHSFKAKLPAGLKHSDARAILVPRLTEEQIADVLKGEFEHEPDMSGYDRKER